MMLADIEEKIAERLNAKLAGPKNVAVNVAHSALAVPAIDVIVAGGGFVRVAQQYKITPSVLVVVTFRNLRGVQDRRKGVYPILESIIALLADNKLGLKIDGLAPRRLDNITLDQEDREGKVVFQLEFETGFVVEKLSDEQIVDLLAVGLNYYLKPGDDAVDATDEVALRS